MIELNGDLFSIANTYKADLIVCTINLQIKNDGRLVMGAGIAKVFRDKFVDLDLRWGQQLKSTSNRLLYDWHTADNHASIIGLPTKGHWKNPSNIDFVKDSLVELIKYVDFTHSKVIVMTRPGCGHGGLDWADVKKIMIDLGYDNRFIVVDNNWRRSI